MSSSTGDVFNIDNFGPDPVQYSDDDSVQIVEVDSNCDSGAPEWQHQPDWEFVPNSEPDDVSDEGSEDDDMSSGSVSPMTVHSSDDDDDISSGSFSQMTDHSSEDDESCSDGRVSPITDYSDSDDDSPPPPS